MLGISCFVVWLTLLLPSFATGTEVTNQHHCVNPSVRREWRTLSRADRIAWIRAVKCLTELPHSNDLVPTVPKPDDIPPVNTSSSYYDDLVYIHMTLNHMVHFTGLFLPWHRYYVHIYDTAIRTHCEYNGPTPYWDWTLDAADVSNSVIFSDSDPDSGLGGFGLKENKYEVRNGAFAAPGYIRPYPWPHGIRRMFNIQPYKEFPSGSLPDNNILANLSFTPSAIEELVSSNQGKFAEFQRRFERIPGAHPSVHGVVTGDFLGSCPDDAPDSCFPGSTFSPNDPLFWLHHAMIDKVWWQWQNHDPANSRAFHGGSIQVRYNRTAFHLIPNGWPPYYNLSFVLPTAGMLPGASIGDVLNTTGGPLCYTYA